MEHLQSAALDLAHAVMGLVNDLDQYSFEDVEPSPKARQIEYLETATSAWTVFQEAANAELSCLPE